MSCTKAEHKVQVFQSCYCGCVRERDIGSFNPSVIYIKLLQQLLKTICALFCETQNSCSSQLVKANQYLSSLSRSAPEFYDTVELAVAIRVMEDVSFVGRL